MEQQENNDGIIDEEDEKCRLDLISYFIIIICIILMLLFIYIPIILYKILYHDKIPLQQQQHYYQ